MDFSPSASDLRAAVRALAGLGVCCPEAQADGVPCARPRSDCLTCDRADPIRQDLLRQLAATAALTSVVD